MAVRLDPFQNIVGVGWPSAEDVTSLGLFLVNNTDTINPSVFSSFSGYIFNVTLPIDEESAALGEDLGEPDPTIDPPEEAVRIDFMVTGDGWFQQDEWPSLQGSGDPVQEASSRFQVAMQANNSGDNLPTGETVFTYLEGKTLNINGYEGSSDFGDFQFDLADHVEVSNDNYVVYTWESGFIPFQDDVTHYVTLTSPSTGD